MFQQDYLMRLIWQFVEGMRRSLERGKKDPNLAAESLEATLTDALDIDAGILLGLAPESFASIVQVSGTDPRVVEYAVRCLVLEAHYLEAANKNAVADLRYSQAQALGGAFGVAVPARGEIPCEADLDALLEQEGIEGEPPA